MGDKAQVLKKSGGSIFESYMTGSKAAKAEVSAEERQKRTLNQQFKNLDKIKGIYLHGEPGCGKSQI